MTLVELESKPLEDLHEMAKGLELSNYSRLKKHDLALRILQEQSAREGQVVAEGVLEVLAEGWGFLRVGQNYAPCSREMFEIQYGRTGQQPNCLDNLAAALEPFGIDADAIPIAFNVFMNVEIDAATGGLRVKPPRSRAGDSIEFRAEIDLIVGVSACSADTANAGTFGPIDLEVREL